MYQCLKAATLTLLLALSVFTIGCSEADNPATSASTSLNPDGTTVDPQTPAGLPTTPEERFAQAHAKALKELGLKEEPSFKGGMKGIDSYRTDVLYNETDGKFGFRHAHMREGISGTTLTQEIYLEWRSGYAYNLIIPMSREDYNALRFIWVDCVSWRFVENDEATGLSGLLIRNDPRAWWGWGVFYALRSINGEGNFWPPYEPINWMIDDNGEALTRGPYYSLVPTVAATYNLSGAAFYDLNGNGTQDDGEPGIEGISVSISGGASTTTDANGNYSFSDLAESEYTVTAGAFNDRSHTTSESVSVTIDGSDGAANFGYSGYSITGAVWYDLNGNGSIEAGEPGLGGQSVTLTPGSSTSTSGNGDYSFTSLLPGNYNVSVEPVGGFTSTTGLSANVSITTTDGTVNFGNALDINWFDGKHVSSVQGMGWWKENINKAIRGQVRGIQISAAALESLRSTLSTFAYPVLNYASLNAAYTALSYGGGNASSRAIQHFTASEYNFANGALVNGDALATYALMVWGEYVATNAGSFSDAYLNAMKDLFEHFNGGELEVPDPLR